jgi:hypothetical protein
MNFSVAGIALIVFLVLGIQFVLKRMTEERTPTFKAYWKRVRRNLEAKTGNVFVSLAGSILVTLIISMVSFRQVWSNDVFHVVFLASLLRNRAEFLFYSIFEVDLEV